MVSVSRRSVPRRGGAERGSVTLQIVVLFPVMLLIIFGVIQGAVWYHGRNVAIAAAQEGARAAAAENGTAAAGSDAANEYLNGAGAGSFINGLTVHPNRGNGIGTVSITGTALEVVPGFPPLTISHTATMPIERLTDPGDP